jgi:cephalosporin hydroxylase
MNLKRRAVKLINFLVDPKRPLTQPLADHAPLREIQEKAKVRTDISEHLETLFVESLGVRPKLIVELGVRGGESTFVLERVARLFGSTLVSVDIEDCTKVCSWDKWHFVKSDDIAFAKAFPAWCQERGIEPRIDVLFIDTSHLSKHTNEEIDSWFPYLSDRSKVFFHDTNVRELIYRKDGSAFRAVPLEERGVIKALDRYFGKTFNETTDFFDYKNGWLIKHHSYCHGFTVLERVTIAS